jgi:hypothetical protein
MGWMTVVRFPVRITYFSSSPLVHIGSQAHPVYYPMGVGGLSTAVKILLEAKQQLVLRPKIVQLYRHSSIRLPDAVLN